MNQPEYTLIVQKALGDLGYVVNAEQLENGVKFSAEKEGVSYDFNVPIGAINLTKTDEEVVDSFWATFSAVKERNDEILLLSCLDVVLAATS